MTTTRGALRELSGGHERDVRRVWYALRGIDVDPDGVTKLTGIKPDRVGRRGEPTPWTGIPRAEGLWLLFSGLGDADEFHEHLDALVGRLRPAWGAFVDLGRVHNAEVGAAIHLVEAQGPLIVVLPDVSASLAELGAAFAFDLYALTEEDDDADSSEPDTG